jgi:hypothetical protein
LAQRRSRVLSRNVPGTVRAYGWLIPVRPGGRGAGTPVSTVFRSQRLAPAVAVAFGVLTLGAGLSTVPLDSLIHQSGPGGPAADWLLTAVVLVPEAALGTLLAARRPRNPLGWILLAIVFVSIAPADQYAALDYRMHHGMLPLGGLAVTVGAAWPLFLLLIAVVLWLFPDGRVPAGRWRRAAVIALVAGALLALAASGSGVAAAAGHDIRVNADGSLLTEQAGIWNILHSALVIAVAASWLTWPSRYPDTGMRLANAASSSNGSTAAPSSS